MQRVDTPLHNNILLSLLLSNTNASVGNHYRRSRIFVFMFIPSILQELKQNIEKHCILFVVHKNTKLIINFLIKFYVIVFLFFMILKRKLYPEVFGLRLQYQPFLHTHTRICVLCGHYFSSNIRFHSHWM